MKPFLSRTAVLAPACLALTLASGGPNSAVAEPVEGETFLTSVMDGVMSLVVHGAIAALRQTFDLRYERIVTDWRQGYFEISGVTATLGALPFDPEELRGFGTSPDARTKLNEKLASLQCGVNIGRITARNTGFDRDEWLRVDLSVQDAKISPACFRMADFPADLAEALGATPLDADVMMRYDRASMALQAASAVHAPGWGRVDMALDFDSFAISLNGQLDGLYRSPDRHGPPFAPIMGALKSAEVTFHNDGAWQYALDHGALPPFARDPEALGQLVASGLGRDLPRPVADQIGKAASEFAAKPEVLSLTYAPENPLGLVHLFMVGPVPELIEPGALTVRAAPAKPIAKLVDAAGLEAAQNRRAEPATRRDVGLALARGEGVPRNAALALKLLEEVEDDPEAAEAVARLQIEQDPARAYARARQAAAAGLARSLLDVIETRVGVEAILAAQLDAPAEPPVEGDYATVDSLRRAAREYMDGQPRLRDYPMALRLALIASAAGDVSSKLMVDQLEARFAHAPAWAEIRTKAEGAATDDWVKMDLGARLVE